MWFGLTIARSSPASTQWCRKTEFRTARARQADAEGDVGDAERGLHARQLGLDQPDALDRLDRGRLPLLVAGGQREGQRVEDQQLGVHPVLVADELVDALGDLELALARSWPCRPRRSSARSARRRAPCAIGTTRVELVAAGLEVDRVDDRAAGDLVERGLDHLGLGRVDLDRRGLRERDLLGHAGASARPRPGARSARRRGRARARRPRPGPRRPAAGRRSRRRAAAPWPCASPASSRARRRASGAGSCTSGAAAIIEETCGGRGAGRGADRVRRRSAR